MSEKYKQLKVKDLQALLEKNGLSQTGKKDELIERLVHFEKRKELEKLEKELDLEDFGDSRLQASYKSLDMLKESVLSDDEDLLIENPLSPSKPAAPVVNTEREGERPVRQHVFKFTPITFDKSQGTTDKTSPADQTKSDAQRRLERMKRFGVKVSEEEMKQLRAARFGTTTERKTAEIKMEPKTTDRKTAATQKRAVKTKKKKEEDNLTKHPVRAKSVVTQKKHRTGPLLKNVHLSQIVTQIHQKKHRLIPTVNRKRGANSKPWMVKNKERKRLAENDGLTSNGRIVTFEANLQKPAKKRELPKRTVQVSNKRKVHVQENINLNARFKKRRI